VRITPAEVRWRDIPDSHGAQQAILLGDPEKPGMYVVRVKFPPHVMDAPHWHPDYSTGETSVLGAIVAGATHRSLTDYLSEKIWAPAGMEQDATWWVDGPDGLAWGPGSRQMSESSTSPIGHPPPTIAEKTPRERARP
jgi:CubicO group peptidase (beta-lactamase class C family)